jgi:hypothetical protein
MGATPAVQSLDPPPISDEEPHWKREERWAQHLRKIAKVRFQGEPQ